MTRRLRLLSVAALLSTVGLLVGCSSSGGAAVKAKPSGLNDQTRSGPYLGAQLDPPQPRPAFTLSDNTGKSFAFGTRTAGRPTLLFFGYTNCPDVCPATMADISLALKSLPDALQRKTYVVFVSTDVRRDTAAVLTRWLANFSTNNHATFVGLRGTQPQVDAAQAAAHIFLAEDAGQTHSTQVLLFGPDDYARESFIYNTDSERQQIAHDLPLVASG